MKHDHTHVRGPKVEHEHGTLRELLALAAITVSEDQERALQRHLALMLERNEQMNLTAVRDPSEALMLHVIDSLLGVPFVNGAPAGPLADLGSGGGYPGIPLCIATGRPTVLVESVKKKASFLREVVEALGVPCEVVAERAEEYALSSSGTFGVVTARALTALPSLVELAAPLLMPRGRLVAYKGDLSDDELSRGNQAAEICGLTNLETAVTSLPRRDERRTIVVFERVGGPSLRLPRRVGLAQKHPLA